MRKFILVGFLGIVVAFVGAIAGTRLWRGETLSADKVKEKWGQQSFDVQKFKSSEASVRSKMAFALLKEQNQFLGKSVPEIRSLLGDPDGFYFTDMFPAYIIQEAKSKGEETWQIVFLLDDKHLVSKVIAHRQ